MSSDDSQTADQTDETARTVGQLMKYSREVNNSDTVMEVGSYAVEATFHVLAERPSPTVFEIAHGDVRVVESMVPEFETGDSAGQLARLAASEDRTVVATGGDVRCVAGDDVLSVSPADLGGDLPAVSIAAPSLYREDLGTVGVVLQVQWDALETVERHHVTPVGYLADHLATAVANIRSHERLERARNDLATRKERIELYDRLLRHDLGNDLQVIAGYSDLLVSETDGLSPEVTRYARTIHRTAESAADMVDRVGTLVRTLEDEAEPAVERLEPVLSDAVRGTSARYDSLSVEYDPDEFDVDVYAGDLLDSVFVNVLSNAAVHNDGGVTVDVCAAEPSPGRIIVSFADDGTGIADPVREDIFEMGRTGPESDGTGFGLGFARALTESYGGAVAVGESRLGGADVRITLERA